MQVSVVALDRSVAAMEIRKYSLARPNNPSFASFFGGAVALPGAGGDLWLNPEVLRGAVGRSFPGLRVLRMPYVLNGVRYHSDSGRSLGMGVHLADQAPDPAHSHAVMSVSLASKTPT